MSASAIRPREPGAIRPSVWQAPLKRFAHSIMLAWGWRRAAIAFAAGALSTLALAPLNAWPVLAVTFPVLVWLIDGAAAGRLGGAWAAASVGWWFGFGYFLAGFYWVGHAFLVFDAPPPGDALPLNAFQIAFDGRLTPTDQR